VTAAGDGAYIGSCSHDKTVKFWDLENLPAIVEVRWVLVGMKGAAVLGCGSNGDLLAKPYCQASFVHHEMKFSYSTCPSSSLPVPYASFMLARGVR